MYLIQRCDENNFKSYVERVTFCFALYSHWLNFSWTLAKYRGWWLCTFADTLWHHFGSLGFKSNLCHWWLVAQFVYLRERWGGVTHAGVLSWILHSSNRQTHAYSVERKFKGRSVLANNNVRPKHVGILWFNLSQPRTGCDFAVCTQRRGSGVTGYPNTGTVLLIKVQQKSDSSIPSRQNTPQQPVNQLCWSSMLFETGD